MGGKTERTDAPWYQQKTPCKKKSREKKLKKYFRSLLLLNLFMEGAHMGKNRLEKKIETEKTEQKTERAALHYTNGSLL